MPEHLLPRPGVREHHPRDGQCLRRADQHRVNAPASHPQQPDAHVRDLPGNECPSQRARGSLAIRDPELRPPDGRVAMRERGDPRTRPAIPVEQHNLNPIGVVMPTRPLHTTWRTRLKLSFSSSWS